MQHTTNSVILAGLLAVVFCGCSTPPASEVSALNLDLPDAYVSGTSGATNEPAAWLDDFSDERLTALVEEALLRNHDLHAAASRLLAAEAGTRVARGGQFPSARAGFNASRNKRSTSTGFRLTDPVTDNLGLNGTLAWELDLWGKFANRTRAALADYQAGAAEYHGVRLSLAVNTARTWFNAIEAELQDRLARDSLKSFESNLQVMEQGFQRGVIEALDVRLIRANVASARGTLEFRTRQRDASARALEVLLGRYPSDEITVAASLPAISREVPAGLPSRLLERRPDLVAAERRLAAAGERATESVKNRLPTLSLTVSGGTSSSELRDLIDPDANVWSLAANLGAPIFQGGRLKAEADQDKAARETALAEFRQTALNAFREVETALAAEAFLERQEAALRIAAVESKEAENLAWQRYQRGLTDIITVLESQRRLVAAESSLIQLVNQRLQNRLDLYLALGGDFAAPASPETREVAQTQADTRP